MALLSSPTRSPELPDLPTLPFETVPDLPESPTRDLFSFSTTLSNHTNIANTIHINTSSDPPLFSSDDLPASSAENYLRPNTKKRQFRGQWWDEHEIDRNAKRVQVEQGRRGGDQRGGENESKRGRGPFKRCWDSGVWLGSDDSVEDKEPEYQPAMRDKEGKWQDADEEVAKFDGERRRDRAVEDEESTDTELRDLALDNLEDNERTEGFVWPYWQAQPEDLTAFHKAQGIASARVIDCVEKEKEKVDLS